MKTKAWAILVGAMLLALAGRAAESADDAAIREIVAEQAAAWSAGDVARYCRHVSPDVSFTNVFGMVVHGKEAFTARHSEILRTFYRGTTKHHQVRRVRFVTPEVAIVDIDNEIHGARAMPGGLPVPADGIIRTQLMQVYVRRDGAWLLEAFHNVDVKPMPKRGADSADSAVLSQIRAASREWDQLFNRGESANLAALYAENAVSMPPNSPTIFGRDAIRAEFARFFAANRARHETTVDQILEREDLAIEVARYRLTFSPRAGGAEVVESGRHIEIRRRIEGEWRIVLEIWNTDAAPAGSD